MGLKHTRNVADVVDSMMDVASKTEGGGGGASFV